MSTWTRCHQRYNINTLPNRFLEYISYCYYVRHVFEYIYFREGAMVRLHLSIVLLLLHDIRMTDPHTHLRPDPQVKPWCFSVWWFFRLVCSSLTGVHKGKPTVANPRSLPQRAGRLHLFVHEHQGRGVVHLHALEVDSGITRVMVARL